MWNFQHSHFNSDLAPCLAFPLKELCVFHFFLLEKYSFAIKVKCSSSSSQTFLLKISILSRYPQIMLQIPPTMSAASVKNLMYAAQFTENHCFIINKSVWYVKGPYVAANKIHKNKTME